jgi:hypothetical protein
MSESRILIVHLRERASEEALHGTLVTLVTLFGAAKGRSCAAR